MASIPATAAGRLIDNRLIAAATVSPLSRAAAGISADTAAAGAAPGEIKASWALLVRSDGSIAWAFWKSAIASSIRPKALWARPRLL